MGLISRVSSRTYRDYIMSSSLMQEVILEESQADREKYDNQGEVYAIVMSIEALEKAYVKDCLTQDQYVQQCNRLLAQYKQAWNLLDHSEIDNIESFVKIYTLKVPLALERIRVDRPLNIKDDKGNTKRLIAEITTSYITTSNFLEMGLTATDDLLSNLQTLHHNLERISNLPSESDAITKIALWMQKLRNKSASEEIEEDEVRQMKLDISTAQNAFDFFLDES